jgi:hypothetical protein
LLVRRRLGIKKWPYKDTRVMVPSLASPLRSDEPWPSPGSFVSLPHSPPAGPQPARSPYELVTSPANAACDYPASPPPREATLPPAKREEEVVTAVHALLSLNGFPAAAAAAAVVAATAVAGAEPPRRVSYVDLIRLNAAVVQ